MTLPTPLVKRAAPRDSLSPTSRSRGVKTLFIELGSPWENGCCESFNSKLRDELLNGQIFTILREAQVLIESWRRRCNAVRPHSSLGYRPPAPQTILPPALGLLYAALRSAHALDEAPDL
jgi:putative transposase